MSSLSRQLRARRGYLLLVGVLLLTLYVLLPQLGNFRSSWQLLRHPALAWTLTAVGLTLLTYFAASATYGFLAFKPLAYGQTLIVELAATFINRLLPGGVGALGTNFAYLRRNKHTSSQAATAVAVNNLLGVIGHGLVLVVALLTMSGRGLTGLHRSATTSWWEVGIIIGAIMLIGLLVLAGRRFKRAATDLMHQVISYRHRPARLGAALISSVVLTLSNVLCLGCCALALSVHLSFLAILLIFSFGVGAGTASPTPGGLGGFEAGLTAGFIAAGVDSSVALAIALLYRLISYWLPLVLGIPAIIVAQRRRLFAA